jgi:hypothetical protein
MGPLAVWFCQMIAFSKPLRIVLKRPIRLTVGLARLRKLMLPVTCGIRCHSSPLSVVADEDALTWLNGDMREARALVV